MAQILRYWECPLKGDGFHSYVDPENNWTSYPDDPSYGTISAYFELFNYDWDNMPLRLTSSSSNDELIAVANLIFHCGVSVDMNYSYRASSASISDVVLALQDYFRFPNTIGYIERGNYSDAQWIAELHVELENSRPIQYRGSGPDGGHSFICDGYDDDYYGELFFHFNWGWSGSNNGWYIIDDLTPSNYNFNNNQAAVIGIEKENILPTIQISQPIQGDNISGIVNITALANDNESGVFKVSFYIDDIEIGTDFEEPYSVQWNTTGYSDGSYSIKAIVTDNHRNTNEQTINVNVINEEPSLYAGSVSPPQGTTDNNFEFSIFYKDPIGSAPNSVTVHGSSWNFPMNPNGSNYDQGVEFTKTLSFSNPGVVDYYFEAVSSDGDNLRYPETGYLQLNVTQSAVGWNILVSDLVVDPTYMTSGGNVDAEGEIHNNCSHTYNNLQYKFEMYNPSGNLIDEETGTVSSISPFTTVDVEKILTTQVTQGLYNENANI